MNKIFQELKGKTESNPALRGMPFYAAFIHTKEGPKILENNSRPGDPEIINILPLLKYDFIDVCFSMIEGNLTKAELENEASVVTYKVPATYGNYIDLFKDKAKRNEIDTPIDLAKAYDLSKKYNDSIRVYPASIELKNDESFALRSRAVCVVGMADTIEDARQISLEGITNITGGGLWNRNDIASKEHIHKSIAHMQRLRGS